MQGHGVPQSCAIAMPFAKLAAELLVNDVETVREGLKFRVPCFVDSCGQMFTMQSLAAADFSHTPVC